LACPLCALPPAGPTGSLRTLSVERRWHPTEFATQSPLVLKPDVEWPLYEKPTVTSTECFHHDRATLASCGLAHAWQPYRWDVTDVVRPGSNDLEVEVTHGRSRPRGWCASSGCRTRRPSCWRARRPGASRRNCGTCPTGRWKRPDCRAAYGFAWPGPAGGAVRFSQAMPLDTDHGGQITRSFPVPRQELCGSENDGRIGRPVPPIAPSHTTVCRFLCGRRRPPAQGRFFWWLRGSLI
jgi:hypothetical protein